MGVTRVIIFVLTCLLCPFLGSYAFGLGGRLSVTLNPVLAIPLQDITPPHCGLAVSNSSHSFMMYFFGVVDEIGAMVDEGKLSYDGLFEELEKNLDPHIRQSLVKLADHPKFARIRRGTAFSISAVVLIQKIYWTPI